MDGAHGGGGGWRLLGQDSQHKGCDEGNCSWVEGVNVLLLSLLSLARSLVVRPVMGRIGSDSHADKHCFRGEVKIFLHVVNRVLSNWLLYTFKCFISHCKDT